MYIWLELVYRSCKQIRTKRRLSFVMSCLMLVGGILCQICASKILHSWSVSSVCLKHLKFLHNMAKCTTSLSCSRILTDLKLCQKQHTCHLFSCLEHTEWINRKEVDYAAGVVSMRSFYGQCGYNCRGSELQTFQSLFLKSTGGEYLILFERFL